MSLASRLGLVSCPDRQAAENNGESQIDTGCDGGGGDTLYNAPKFGVCFQRILKSFPDFAQVAQVDKEDGDHGVGSNPEEGEKDDPETVEPSPPASSGARQWHIRPDDVDGFGRQFNCRAMGLLSAGEVGNLVRLGDL